jgi:exopolyphosphatase / guanosine-5'-triphosphate,3'-diphosphate pyrophosphatase
MPSQSDLEETSDAHPSESKGLVAGAVAGATLDPADAPQPDFDAAFAPLQTYAALDLGTNNCRLLIARPAFRNHALSGFKIIDSFSRIVRLGEGVSRTGRLSESAIRRTMSALDVCRAKMRARHVTRARLIATEACRAAANGPEFIARVRDVLGLELEIVDRQTEAHLAAIGCAGLADPAAESAILFDIGGGSSEVIWLGPQKHNGGLGAARDRIKFWVSLKLGVVSLAEKFGGIDVTDESFEAMVRHVEAELGDFIEQAKSQPRCAHFHLLGTSGTVTTVGGVFLNLARYDRRRVDGLWMADKDIDATVMRLRAMPYADRVANGCIGTERADLVLAGCAILEAIRRAFPAKRVRIADRGLREGILLELMSADHATQ